MNNLYELYTIEEDEINNKFWQTEIIIDNENTYIKIEHQKICCDNYKVKHHGCVFESLFILSQANILELSKKYPLIKYQLYYYWPSQTYYSNGEGLFGIWEVKNGKLLLSVQCSYNQYLRHEKKPIDNEPNPMHLLINYLIKRQRMFKLITPLPKDSGY
jgi:hypothetical protein